MQGALGHKQKPQCVHISNVHADLLPTDVYSGMYARVTVSFFPYDASGNRGVGFVWARYQYGEDLVKKPAEAMQE